MSLTLAGTALVMGLVGGPHCMAMCGAACGGVIRGVGARPVAGMWTFQGGRLLGYSIAGGAAGLAMQGFAWLSSNTAALQPVWTLFHLAVLLWGLMLLAQARQPAWVESAGRTVWSKVRPMAQRPGGLLVTGALWALMPCGLLYSALLVAALTGSPMEGALSMALFAIGSGISLGLAPSALRKLQQWGNSLRKDWGTRIAGLLLAATAAWALWMDLAHRVAEWCGIA
ncbi:MAG TPA: sulfite exporter TauE/SafE family protein [Ramlibacter sp.]|nr:sulfite exporter TauE/SafE family protein [Ramlibacter sp.]